MSDFQRFTGFEMRTVCFLVFLTSLLFTANAAKALNNETLYLACKELADSGYKTSADPFSDGVCVGYAQSVYDRGVAMCQLSKTAPNKMAARMGVAFGFNGENITTLAGIQRYINTMEKKPEKWPEYAFGELLEAFKKLSPCK